MDRKQYQLQIPLTQNVQSGITNGFEKYSFIHNALPEINFDEIDVSAVFCGKKLNAPILISSMTGGNREAGEINARLARTAEKFGIVFAVGSERVLLEAWRRKKDIPLRPSIDSGSRSGRSYFAEILASFAVRKFANPPLFFGNFGAVQLNNGLYFADVKRAMDLISADGIFLHLNSLQEAVQENGNVNFKEVLKRIEEIMSLTDFPVIVKEVGFGMSESVARQLKKVGVKIIDVAGAGGTNFVTIESLNQKSKFKNKNICKNPLETRLDSARQVRVNPGEEKKMVGKNEVDFGHVHEVFKTWGIPTAESLIQTKKVAGLQVIASGGIRNGLEIAKAIALGADLVGIGLPILIAAHKSEAELVKRINTLIFELKLTMFGVGARTLDELRKVELVKKD